jgi:hypothetical protein
VLGFWAGVLAEPNGPRASCTRGQPLRQLGDVGGDAPGLVAGE